MIQDFKLNDLPGRPFEYLKDASCTKPEVITRLQEGITFGKTNIIIGENGSGKSTLIKMLQHLNFTYDLFYTQPDMVGYADIWDTESISKYAGSTANYNLGLFNLRTISTRNENTVTQSFGKFTDFIQAYNNRNASDGQSIRFALSTMTNYIFDPEKQIKPSEHSPIMAAKNSAVLLDYYNKHMSDSKLVTVLMDEPDKGLGIDALNELYGILISDHPQLQLITVIHNVALIHKLLAHDNITFIEMSDKYLEKIKKFFS